jgi:hypothetical protein
MNFNFDRKPAENARARRQPFFGRRSAVKPPSPSNPEGKFRTGGDHGLEAFGGRQGANEQEQEPSEDGTSIHFRFRFDCF